MRPSLIINIILTLFVLLILCSSRKIEKYVKEGMEEPPVMTMEPAVEAEDVVAPVMEVMQEEEPMEEPMEEPTLTPGEPLEENTQVDEVDSLTTDLSLPTFKMPEASGEAPGFMGFSCVSMP